ncbi:MAG: hypothetical protein ACYDEV_10700 [Acidiferrobacter sp.]
MPVCNKGDSRPKDTIEPIDACALVSGPSLGQYAERPIPAWVQDTQGIVWDFVRIVADLEFLFLDDLADDEIVIAPGLVYKRRGDRQAPPKPL